MTKIFGAARHWPTVVQ